MGEQFINPNWHVLLIHLPLGLLGVGFLIELFSFLWRSAGLRVAGRWMILLGVLGAVPAATSGLYAFRDVVNPRSGPDDTWSVVSQGSDWTATQWELMSDHATLAAWATGLLLIVVIAYMAAGEMWRRRLYVPLLLGGLAGLGLFATAAWHAGEAVYGQGVAVQMSRTTPSPAHAPAVLSATAPATQRAIVVPPTLRPVAPARRTWMEKLEYYVPPMQAHLIGAGLAVAVALVSIGLSIRRGHLEVEAETQVAPAAAASSSLNDPIAQALQCKPPLESALHTPPPMVYPARFWLVACVLGILSIAGGIWAAGDWPFTQLINQLQHDLDIRQYRLVAHVVFAVAFVVLTLMLALLLRLIPRRRLLAGIFWGLLLVVVVGQVWVGILLLFDTPDGPLLHFNTPAATR